MAVTIDQCLAMVEAVERSGIKFVQGHSKAYDTLLQMGRWFGYRPRYADLCRIWMAAEDIQ